MSQATWKRPETAKEAEEAPQLERLNRAPDRIEFRQSGRVSKIS